MKYAVCRQIGGEADTTYELNSRTKRCIVTVPPLEPRCLVVSVHSREHVANGRAFNERVRTLPGAYDYGSTRQGTHFFVVPVDHARKGDILDMSLAEKAAA